MCLKGSCCCHYTASVGFVIDVFTAASAIFRSTQHDELGLVYSAGRSPGWSQYPQQPRTARSTYRRRRTGYCRQRRRSVTVANSPRLAADQGPVRSTIPRTPTNMGHDDPAPVKHGEADLEDLSLNKWLTDLLIIGLLCDILDPFRTSVEVDG